MCPPPKLLSIPSGLLLRNLRLDFYTWYQPVQDAAREELSTVAPYFQISSLRQLDLVNIFSEGTYDTTGEYFSVPSTGQKSNVEDLRVLRCRDFPRIGRVRMIKRLLEHITILKRFVLTTPYEGRHDQGLFNQPDLVGADVCMRGISSGLSNHLDTLEELVLFSSDGILGCLPAIDDYLNYTGKAFTRLRRLAVPEWIVRTDLARDRRIFFQGALEEIQIQFSLNIGDFRGCHGEDDSRDEKTGLMNTLVEAKKNGTLLRLKSVVWWYQPYQKYEGHIPSGADAPLFNSYSQLLDCGKKFEQADVNFEWASTPSLSETPVGMRLDGIF